MGNPWRGASTAGRGVAVPLLVPASLQIGRRNRRRPAERRRGTIAHVVPGTLVNDRNLNGLGAGRSERRRTQIERMFYGRRSGGGRLTLGVATAGHDAVALAGEDYAKFVPEIVLEVDDSGVRIDVPGACGGAKGQRPWGTTDFNAILGRDFMSLFSDYHIGGKSHIIIV